MIIVYKMIFLIVLTLMVGCNNGVTLINEPPNKINEIYLAANNPNKLYIQYFNFENKTDIEISNEIYNYLDEKGFFLNEGKTVEKIEFDDIENERIDIFVYLK